jgi:hypothetical protein
LPANRPWQFLLIHGKACYLSGLPSDCHWQEVCLPEAEDRRFEATDTSA